MNRPFAKKTAKPSPLSGVGPDLDFSKPPLDFTPNEPVQDFRDVELGTAYSVSGRDVRLLSSLGLGWTETKRRLGLSASQAEGYRSDFLIGQAVARTAYLRSLWDLTKDADPKNRLSALAALSKTLVEQGKEASAEECKAHSVDPVAEKKAAVKALSTEELKARLGKLGIGPG